ncbi:MAG: hypothetical protein ACE5JR_09145 [Gemmatimonadota bacterium]
MSHHIELEVKGSTDFAGRFTGKGRLTLHISDATKALVGLDYRRPDRLVLNLHSTAGLKLSADDTLTLSGGLTHDLLNQRLGGKVSARLKIANSLGASIEQEFGQSGPRTSLSVKLRL